MVAAGEWMENVPERGQHVQRQGAAGITEGYLWDRILGKGLTGAGDWKLLRKKRVAEVKSRNAENYQT